MAKPKFPRKNADLKQNSAGAGAPPVPNPGITPAEAAATPAIPETKNTETKNATPRKAASKPEIVRSEARANFVSTNLIPINLEDEIRQLAYLLSERRGFEAGHETEDWLAAEREVRQRYRQLSA